MIENWFDGWLDIEVIEKKEENEICNNDNDLFHTDRADSNDTSTLQYI